MTAGRPRHLARTPRLSGIMSSILAWYTEGLRFACWGAYHTTYSTAEQCTVLLPTLPRDAGTTVVSTGLRGDLWQELNHPRGLLG
jgi:hypothetical protein